MSQRQPILNAPPVVTWLLGLFAGVHVIRALLPQSWDVWLTVLLGFIAARLGVSAGEFPGGQLAGVASLVTHMFVHGDVAHLLINSAWFLAFGTPIARRADTFSFTSFFLLTGVAGALFYLLVNPSSDALVVGASGGVSGLMGAMLRFLFSEIDAQPKRHLHERGIGAPLMTLAEAMRDRRILAALIGWVLLNIVLALGAPAFTQGAGIAWEAHLGGFCTGLLMFGFFDAAPPVRQHVADPE